MPKKTVKTIADTLTDDAIAAACDVGTHSVRNARWRGVFPSSWYPVVREMCDKAGIDCPEVAFNFKSPSSVAPSSEAAQPEVSCLTEKRRNAANGVQGSGNPDLAGGAV